MPRGSTDAALLADVGRRFLLSGEPLLVNVHHADTYRWQDVAVRVAFDGSADAVRERTLRAQDAQVRAPRVVGLVEGSGCAALLSEWCEGSEDAVDPEALGSQLARLHRAPAPDFLPGLPEMLQRRWRHGPSLPVRLPPALRAVVRRSGQVLEEVSARSRTAFLHGDMIPGNVVWGHGGPVLVDWELAAAGSAWWDLAHLQAYADRFDADAVDMDRLFTGYGHDPRGDAAFDRLCRVRHAMNTVSALYRAEADGSGVWAEEAERRLAFWEGDERPWSDLAAPALWS